MQYNFPDIEHISEVLKAIEGHQEFTVADRGNYTIINYNVVTDETFPDIKVSGGTAKMRAERSRINMLRRECRGIIFSNITGKVLRRPFHKFFNVNERTETQLSVLDFTKNHTVYEKLDGSMICPFFDPNNNNEIYWGTKMCAPDFHELVSNFIADKPKYLDFACNMLSKNITPIFEYCSRKKKIVIDYPEDNLVLLAMRDMKSGRYHLL